MNLSSVSKARLAVMAALPATIALTALALQDSRLAEASIAGAATLVLAVATLWLMQAGRSIAKAVTALDAAAHGKLGARVLHIKGQGDLGRLLRNINRLFDLTEAFAREANAATRAAVNKQFYRRIRSEGMIGDFGRYSDAVNEALEASRRQSGLLDMFTSRMLADSVLIAMNVNEGAISNARMLCELRDLDTQAQGMSAATEQLVSGVHDISSRSTEAARMAFEAKDATSQGRDIIGRAGANMADANQAVIAAAGKVDELAHASEQIAEILGTIEDIASQTNLLALNATIEAARAGDAGKGFAVVANEVKTLSNQTARATEDIRERIGRLRAEMGNVVETMEHGTQAVSEGRRTMDDVAEQMQGIMNLIDGASTHMGDLAHILTEQSAAAGQVASGVGAVAQRAASNTKSVERSTRALSTVTGNIDELLKLLAEQDIPGKIILLAQADHVMWKKRLLDMVVGTGRLDHKELADHQSCRLGKWYYGAASLPYRGYDAFIKLEDPHRRVHFHGIEAVRLFNSNDVDNAMPHIGKMEKASEEVMVLLQDLQLIATGKTESAPAPMARRASF